MTLQNFTLGTFAQGAAGGGGSFESIASASGTGSSGTISFTSIPSTYQHLQIRGIVRGTSVVASRDLNLQLNSDTGSNYKSHYLLGNGTSASAGYDGGGATTSIWLGGVYGNGAAASTVATIIIDIQDYKSTTKNKTVRSFSGRDQNAGDTTGTVYLASGLWLSTSAITTVSLVIDSGSFGTSTQFALYGIKGA